MSHELRPLRRKVEPLNDAARDIRDRLLNCLDAAARRPEDALALARGVGGMLAEQCLTAIGIKPSGMFDACLAQLEEPGVMSRGLVPAEIITMLHKVRTIGNKAVHDKLRIEVTVDDVVSVLGDVLRVTKWYLGEFTRGPRLDPVFRAMAPLLASDAPPRVVMLGSACLGLPRHREEVRAACKELGCLPRVAEPQAAAGRGAGAGLALVDEADVYVGVFGYRYGQVPKGQTQSFEHLEYERAVERGIPTLIFLMGLDHRVLPADIETGEGAERLRAFKRQMEACKRHPVHSFRSAKDLHAKVLLSLGEYLRQTERGEALPRDPGPRQVGAPAVGVTAQVDAQALRAAGQQILRVETQALSEGGGRKLSVNLGFSRIWIRDASGRRLPVVCGCSTARSEVRFNGGRSDVDPACATLAPEARLVVEFGTGPARSCAWRRVRPGPFWKGGRGWCSKYRRIQSGRRTGRGRR